MGVSCWGGSAGLRHAIHFCAVIAHAVLLLARSTGGIRISSCIGIHFDGANQHLKLSAMAFVFNSICLSVSLDWQSMSPM
jgi:hypothetical protein